MSRIHAKGGEQPAALPSIQPKSAHRHATQVISGQSGPSNGDATLGMPRFLAARVASSSKHNHPDVLAPHDANEQAADAVSGRVADAWARHRPSGLGEGFGQTKRKLSAEERQLIEPSLGHEVGDVEIHSDRLSAAMARAFDAEALTIGTDIYLGAGQERRDSRSFYALLAHELTHVIQQRSSGLAIQPKLKITGQNKEVARTSALLNTNLGSFYYVSIDASGEVKMAPVRAAHTSSATGPSSSQKAIADRLWKVINDPKDVVMTVSAGSRVVGGSYALGEFDIADLEVYGVAGLIHEIEEQYQKQVNGKSFKGGAHAEAEKAEAEVRGAVRGKENWIYKTPNADGTVDAKVEIPHTFPDNSVKTMVMTIKSNNIESVTWK